MTIRPMIFLVDTSGYEVEWAFGFPLPGDQTASEFYKCGKSFICKVKKDGFTVDIYLDGDMLYRHQDGDVIRDGVELYGRGYRTDKIFTDAIESEELTHDMNPWFDMYVRGEHLDCVTHDINEALQSAMAWLDEETTNAKQIENVGVSGLDLPA